LDKELYDNYLCLAASNKQQINETMSTNQLQNLEIGIKRVRIRPKYNATVAFSWQEDKDGTKQINKQANQRQIIVYRIK